MMENSSNMRHEEEICNSQPISLPSSEDLTPEYKSHETQRPPKYTGQRGNFRSVEEIDVTYRHVFMYPYFNLVQSRVIDDALYSNKSMVVCAPTGSGKTVIFEMAIVQLLMDLKDKKNTDDFKIIYMAPVKALCTERLTEWYSKFNKLGILCIEVTGDTDVDFPQLKPYRIIITTPEKWDMLTRRWMEHNLVKVVKLFLIDEVHILNDEARGPVLEAVVSRMKTIESSVRSGVRLVAVSATVSNPQDVATWLGAGGAPAVHYKFGDECRPVKLTRVVEGYPCSSGTSVFKFDIILNYKLWPIIQKYHDGKPTLIFCNTRKSVMLTAETLSREITVSFSQEQRGKLTALASTMKNKKIQSLIISGVGCHHAGLLFEERTNIEQAFRNRDLPILITTTTLAMGVNLPAHLVIIKNTQQYVNGAYQEYSISTVLQMMGRAGRPQHDSAATAVIMTTTRDKARYQSLVGGSEPLQSFLHKRLAENINSEVALGTIGDVARCVQWLNSTFLRVRAARDPKRYLGLPPSAPEPLITKKIEELCVKALNGLESSGLVTMDELSCVESTEAGRLMSLHYLDLETMKLIMKIDGTETLERLLWLVCESHELSDMHLRVDERRCLNELNRNNGAPTIRYQMKGKISSRQMKLNCIIQSVLGCLPIPDPSLNQEALKIMRTADRVCKCLVSYVTRPNLVSQIPKHYGAILNSLILAKCITAHLWENSLYVSRQLKGIGPTFSTLLASAGKTNFTLLDESHPRDLERIMNKGPPAGNILRKQINLLPKYNITITSLNEQCIRVQLSLLNRSHLAENIDTLTAGAGHKCYIVVGDTENFLLYFSSFKDSDLINIYDGIMSFEVRRRHLHNHKVIAHCISSSFVGIDDQCEYIFKDINPFPVSIPKASHTATPQKISPNRQTYITDVFKERKRKNNDNDSPNVKDKKKRENLLIDKFKTLNKSFETAKGNKEKCTEPKKAVTEHLKDPKPQYSNIPNSPDNMEVKASDLLDDFDYEDIDNERINNLLNKIENEVNNPSTSKIYSIASKKSNQNGFNKNNSRTFSRDKVNMCRNNFTFIDKLEEKNSEYDNDNDTDNKESEFSNSIKSHVQKYLQKAQDNINNTLMNSEYKEINYEVINTHIDSKGDFSQENDIIDIINKSHDDDDDDDDRIKSPDKCITSPNKKQISFDNKVHAINTDKIISNIEDKGSNEVCSLIYGPEVTKPEAISNNLKLETLETSTNANQSRSFSADCTLTPREPNFELKELKNVDKSNVDNLLFNYSEENNSDINIQNQNTGKNFMDIKKYSFNTIKTIGVHNENVSKICTLKVALDVTEIIHKENNKFDTKNDPKDNIQNVLTNIDKTATVSERNIKNIKPPNNEYYLLAKKLQIETPPNEISDTSIENKETTLEDILDKFNKNTTRQNYLRDEENDFENYTKQAITKLKTPESKPKRKYRISDLDAIDINLPDSLVPSQSQVINRRPDNYKSNEEYKHRSISIREEKPTSSTVIDIGSVSNIPRIIDTDGEDEDNEEFKIDINSDLDEPIVLSTFDLNPPLLDPKTLLKSLNNEDIIPPPPEFCDNIYSVGSREVDTSNVDDLRPDNTVFGTFDDLTSTETDSWILSNTMADINSVDSNRSDFFNSRASKLSKFRFVRKNMLRK